MPALAEPRDAAVAKKVKKTSGISVSDSTIRRALRVHRQKNAGCGQADRS